MMPRVIFAPEARDDLLSLHRYVAAASGPARARAFTEAIVAYCEGFATFPERGRRRDDIRPGLRVIGFRNRVTIAFAVAAERVTILGVLYAGRDFERTFGDET